MYSFAGFHLRNMLVTTARPLRHVYDRRTFEERYVIKNVRRGDLEEGLLTDCAGGYDAGKMHP
jgi:hypothetical protein